MNDNNSPKGSNIWGKVIHIAITVLTAIAAAFGISACS